VFFFFAMEMAKLSGLWLPASFCRIASIVLLAAMGGVMLLKDLVKPIKKETAAPDLRTVYFDAETADADHSHSLSVKEAVLLAVALSMDSLAVGIGIGWQNNRPVGIALFTLLFGVVGTSVGTKIGTRLHRKRKWHGSWMSGVCLLLLALLQAVQG
jgi:putative sporulation protein YtaF